MTHLTGNTIAFLAIIGALVGIWPLVYGVNRNDLQSALIGFFVTIVGGIILGLIGALVVSAISVCVIKKKGSKIENPEVEESDIEKTRIEN